ncbi:hypothetical protein E2320_014344, partial [Naja naja]
MKMATGHPEDGKDLSGLSMEQLLGFSEEDPNRILLPDFFAVIKKMAASGSFTSEGQLMKMDTVPPEGGENLSGLSMEQVLGFSKEDPTQVLLPGNSELWMETAETSPLPGGATTSQAHENNQEPSLALFQGIQSEKGMVGNPGEVPKSVKTCLRNGRKKFSSSHNEVLGLPTQQLRQWEEVGKRFGYGKIDKAKSVFSKYDTNPIEEEQCERQEYGQNINLGSSL